MSITVFNESEIREKYDAIIPKYQRLGQNLKKSIEILLNKEKIDFNKIEFRIKRYDSFLDKIKRKKIKDPFNEIEDLCGLRIISFYYSDLEKINEIIGSEFVVQKSEIKITTYEPDKFGYRSWHFIVKIKEEWLKTPDYRDLSDLVVEIQVRTILMHAWASIEHKLAYKEKAHIPNKMKRRFSSLSALFELADEQFDFLRKEKEEYLNSLTIEGIKTFTNQELNLDSFQSLLDHYFPNRKKTLKETASLLDEILELNISIKYLVLYLEKSKDIWFDLEAQIGKLWADKMKTPEKSKKFKFHQVGVMRVALEVFNDDYWESTKETRPPFLTNLLSKWRDKVSTMTKRMEID